MQNNDCFDTDIYLASEVNEMHVQTLENYGMGTYLSLPLRPSSFLIFLHAMDIVANGNGIGME